MGLGPVDQGSERALVAFGATKKQIEKRIHHVVLHGLRSIVCNIYAWTNGGTEHQANLRNEPFLEDILVAATLIKGELQMTVGIRVFSLWFKMKPARKPQQREADSESRGTPVFPVWRNVKTATTHVQSYNKSSFSKTLTHIPLTTKKMVCGFSAGRYTCSTCEISFSCRWTPRK